MKKVFIVKEYEKNEMNRMAHTADGIQIGIFSTKEHAQKYINAGRPSDKFEYIIVVYELDPSQNEIDKGYRPYIMRMKKSGEIVEMFWASLELDYPEMKDGNWRFGIDAKGYLYFHSFAESDKKALEMCEQVRQKILAEDNWSDLDPFGHLTAKSQVGSPGDCNIIMSKAGGYYE